MTEKYDLDDLLEWLRNVGSDLNPELPERAIRHHGRMIYQTGQAITLLKDIRHRIRWMERHDLMEKTDD